MTDSTSADRDTALRRAYGKATAALRDSHREEFDSLYQQAAAAEGVEWHPRKTAKQKAADTIAALLAEYPDLAPTAEATNSPGHPTE